MVDFLIHEVFQYYKDIFRNQVNLFPKLIAIREKVAMLPEIKQFEESDRCVKEMCPL